eukprot:13854632-Alexandrium_andersonii.AAC.1
MRRSLNRARGRCRANGIASRPPSRLRARRRPGNNMGHSVGDPGRPFQCSAMGHIAHVEASHP